MLFETKFLFSLILTLLVEVPVAFLVAKYIFRVKRISEVVNAGIIASVLTLPYLWFILPSYILSNNYVFYGELMVFAVESVIYVALTNLNWKQSLAVSLIANLASFSFGLLFLKF
jgi:hypothetical protein